MKIMHINCADYGSTGKIIGEIAKGCAQKGYETVLCAGKARGSLSVKTYQTSFRFEQGIYKRICQMGALRYGFAPISTARILHILKKEKPDIVHLHSTNCHMVNIYRLLFELKKKEIPTVVTNHAEFFYTGSCAHANLCDQWVQGCKRCDSVKEATLSLYDRTALAWEKMKKSFEGFKRIQITSVSEWVNGRSKQSGILRELPNMTIKNGLDTSVFSPQADKTVFEKYNIPKAEKYILHVTAQFSTDPKNAKGGHYILQLAERMKGKDVRIIIVGNGAQDVVLPENITYIGRIYNQKELAMLYSHSDVTVITSFRETYSMPVAESLCCGTPVVGFFAGGPESIALPQYSKFIPYGDMDALCKAVEEMLDCKQSVSYLDIANEAKNEYSSETMAQEYIAVYERMYHEKG